MTMAIGDPIGNGAAVGSVLFVGSGPVLAQDQSHFFWDNTNKRLGIGTITPQNGITVSKSSTGAVRIDAVNTNTSPTANAFMTVSVAGAGAGDPVVIYDVAGVQNWAAGVDNSDADKFKIASSAFLGTDDRLVMTTDGKVGMNVSNPSARLHLAAGSATLAPLKLTAGPNLSAPEPGALEFDGTDLFLTLANGIRRHLTSQVTNVLDFGAKGDGITDDAPAVKDAVASLVLTGGVIWFPPHLVYRINTSIDIRSFFPIWVISEMGHGPIMDDTGDQGPALGKGYIKVGAPIDDGVFRWRAPDSGATYLEEAGGGGIRHVHIVDEPLDIAFHLGRNHEIDAAVYVEGATYFMIDDCWFSFLKGTAIKVGRVTVCRINSGRISRCGYDNKPSVHVFGDGNEGYGAARIFDLVLEGSHKAPSLKIEPGTTAIIQRMHFEANAVEPELQQTFVHCSGTCTLLDNTFAALGDNVTQVVYDGVCPPEGPCGLGFQRIMRNTFAGVGTALVMGSDYSQADISNNFFNGSGSTSNVDCGNGRCRCLERRHLHYRCPSSHPHRRNARNFSSYWLDRAWRAWHGDCQSAFFACREYQHDAGSGCLNLGDMVGRQSR